MSLIRPTVCDVVSVCVFRSGSSLPLTYSVSPAHTAAEIGRSEFDSGIRFVFCAEAVREPISATAKRGRCLIVMHLRLALERPPHKLIFLNALLSRIYAFLPRPADMWMTSFARTSGGSSL